MKQLMGYGTIGGRWLTDPSTWSDSAVEFLLLTLTKTTAAQLKDVSITSLHLKIIY
jgi:hypothetical protein